MRLLPERISVPTDRLVALLELAKFGARSEAERLVVAGVEKDLDEISAVQAQRMVEKSLSNSPQTCPVRVGERTVVDSMEVNGYAANFERLAGGSEGAESAGAGDGDGGSQGAESDGAGAKLERTGQ